jgi:hypothetical protein
LLRRRNKKPSYDRGRSLPFFFFLNELLFAGWSNRIILTAPIIFGRTPLRSDPAHLLKFQQSRIDGALVQFKQIAAYLLDATGDPITVEWPKGVQRFED